MRHGTEPWHAFGWVGTILNYLITVGFCVCDAHAGARNRMGRMARAAGLGVNGKAESESAPSPPFPFYNAVWCVRSIQISLWRNHWSRAHVGSSRPDTTRWDFQATRMAPAVLGKDTGRRNGLDCLLSSSITNKPRSLLAMFFRQGYLYKIFSTSKRANSKIGPALSYGTFPPTGPAPLRLQVLSCRSFTCPSRPTKRRVRTSVASLHSPSLQDLPQAKGGISSGWPGQG